MPDVSDLRSTIVPKSDQLNSEQLLAGPMIITVTDVRAGSSEEQPISIHYRNDGGRPFKPCKTMRKVLILAWGADGNEWAGKSMELFNEPTVKFGGVEVGGIRISRMSDIDRPINVSLTATKGKKSLHRIDPLRIERPERTERHDQMVKGFERTVVEHGLQAFIDAWALLPKEDRAAIGKGERDRIAAMAPKPETEDQSEETT